MVLGRLLCLLDERGVDRIQLRLADRYPEIAPCGQNLHRKLRSHSREPDRLKSGRKEVLQHAVHVRNGAASIAHDINYKSVGILLEVSDLALELLERRAEIRRIKTRNSDETDAGVTGRERSSQELVGLGSAQA